MLATAAAQAQNPGPRGVVRIDSGGLKLVHGRTAFYPEPARTGGIEGTVTVEASLDAKGHVVDARVLTGASELRAAALRSVLDAHFAPEESASGRVQLSVIFSLEKAAAPARTAGGGGGSASPFDSADATIPISSIDCGLMPAELCREARRRLADQVGSPLTQEKKTRFEKDLADLDDHLLLNTFKTTKGMVLTIVLRSESPSSLPGGVVGGVPGGVIGGFAAPPPPPPAAVRVGGGIKPPTKVKDVEPVYPAMARTARVQGVVILELTIGPSGAVQGARVLRSIPLLDAAALDAVRQWQFTPTMLNGVAVAVIMTTRVSFSLPDQ